MVQPQSDLFETLLETASAAAEALLNAHPLGSLALAQRQSDLELSPLLDKQLTAAALQVAADRGLSGGVQASLMAWFHTAAPGVTVDAQRRAVDAEVQERGLPMELACDYGAALESRLEAAGVRLPQALWDYAVIYDELWSDPRIGACVATRRVMLAMATVLRARSAQLNAERSAKPAPRRAAPHRVGAGYAVGGAVMNFQR